MAGLRLKLIACRVLEREVMHVAAGCANVIDAELLAKGLHDLGAPKMLSRLQEAVDASRGYDAVLLGYGLCSNGVIGLTARDAPLVIPRAHDCITLFLGSGERYLEYFYSRPGTYFHTTGWIDYSDDLGELRPQSIPSIAGMDMSFEALVARYGEEDARYLYDTLCDTTRNYGRVAFIETGLDPTGSYEQHSREEAARRGWEFERLQGDLRLLRRLVDGPWEEPEFLVVPPGSRVVPAYDDRIITAG